MTTTQSPAQPRNGVDVETLFATIGVVRDQPPLAKFQFRSSVARYVGAQVVERHDPTGACFYTYVGDVDWDGLEFDLGDGVFAGVFPTHGDAACVWLVQPAGAPVPTVPGGRAEAWLEVLRRGRRR